MHDTKPELLGSKYLTASIEPLVGFADGVSDNHTEYNGHAKLGNDQAQFRYDDECGKSVLSQLSNCTVVMNAASRRVQCQQYSQTQIKKNFVFKTGFHLHRPHRSHGKT